MAVFLTDHDTLFRYESNWVPMVINLLFRCDLSWWIAERCLAGRLCQNGSDNLDCFDDNAIRIGLIAICRMVSLCIPSRVKSRILYTMFFQVPLSNFFSIIFRVEFRKFYRIKKLKN